MSIVGNWSGRWAPAQRPLELSLGVVQDMQQAGLRIVPSTPSREMMEAAIRAGAPNERAAKLIYQAMISAES